MSSPSTVKCVSSRLKFHFCRSLKVHAFWLKEQDTSADLEQDGVGAPFDSIDIVPIVMGKSLGGDVCLYVNRRWSSESLPPHRAPVCIYSTLLIAEGIPTNICNCCVRSPSGWHGKDNPGYSQQSVSGYCIRRNKPRNGGFNPLQTRESSVGLVSTVCDVSNITPQQSGLILWDNERHLWILAKGSTQHVRPLLC